MAKVVVVGAGAMGLAAAYRAAKNGHEVDLVEAAPEPGGMAGHFDFDGVSIERFYHFICKTDYPTFELLDELGLGRTPCSGDRQRWALFTGGKLHRWGDPFALLRFPHLSLWQKFRYGLFALVSVRRNKWPAIEHENAKSWIVRWCGRGSLSSGCGGRCSTTSSTSTPTTSRPHGSGHAFAASDDRARA